MGLGRITLIGLGAFAIAAVIVNSKSKSPEQLQAETAAATEFARQAIAPVKKSPDWLNVRITEAKPNSFTFNIDYARPPMGGLTIVEFDTKQIARAVLTALVRAGYQPAKESLSLFVFASQPVKGETSVDLVRSFGHSYYDYNNDRLIFKAN